MKNKELKRLTRSIVEKAERRGIAAGAYALCALGYMPEEIAIFSRGENPYRNDIRQKACDYARKNNLPIPASCAPKRVRTKKTPEVVDCRAAFRDATMKTGFALVLTQPMLENLCSIADGVPSDRVLYYKELGAVRPNNFIATGAALSKRGLIDCRGKLSPIGALVVGLLREAGVFAVSDAALKRSRVTPSTSVQEA